MLKRNTDKKTRYLIGLILLLLIWFNNTSLFSNKSGQNYKLLAHRGLAQTFDESKAGWNSNTAAMIDPPRHPYLENTIPSMQAAFEAGADAVEFDVKLSKDKQLAVFHDSTLEFKSGVKGEVQDYTMAQLKEMDIGYGYTADGGKTYPFRGKGFGLMPTMDEVLRTFPDKEFVIEVKDGKLETYQVLWEKLKSLPSQKLAQLSICGASNEGIDYLRSQSKDLKLLSKDRMIQALIKYELLGFTGYIPEEMKNAELRIPLKYAKFLWGWPHKFMDRMEAVHTRVELTAGGADLSEGFDDADSLESIPKGYGGYIWTNKIDELPLDRSKQ